MGTSFESEYPEKLSKEDMEIFRKERRLVGDRFARLGTRLTVLGWENRVLTNYDWDDDAKEWNKVHYSQ